MSEQGAAVVVKTDSKADFRDSSNPVKNDSAPPKETQRAARITRIRRESLSGNARDIEGSVSFDFPRFLLQFFYHVLWPISLIVAIPVEGLPLMFNQDMLPVAGRRIPWVIFSLIPAITMLYLVCCLVFLPHTRFLGEIWVGVGYVVAHRLVIATKYGLMDDAIYEASKSGRLDDHSKTQTNLVPTWGAPSRQVCEEVLKETGAQLGVDLKNLSVMLSSSEASRFNNVCLKSGQSGSKLVSSKSRKQLDEIELSTQKEGPEPSQMRDENEDAAMGPPDHSLHSDEMGYVCCQNMVTMLIQEVVVSSKIARVSQLTGAGFSMGLFTAVAPIITRAAINPKMAWGDCPNHFGIQVATVGAMVFGCYLGTLFGNVLHSFLFVGRADYFRRYALLRLLGVFIDPTPTPQKELNSLGYTKTSPIFIDLTIPSNISAWLAMREMLVNFGAIFKIRIMWYSTYTALFALGLLIAVLIELFTSQNDFQAMLESHDLRQIQLVVLCGLVVVFHSVEIAFMTFYGWKANEEVTRHRYILMRVELGIREVVAELGEKEDMAQDGGVEGTLSRAGSSPHLDRAVTKMKIKTKTIPLRRLKECIGMLMAVRECLMMLDQTNPITLLGMRADLRVARAVVSVALGGIASVLARTVTGGGASTH